MSEAALTVLPSRMERHSTLVLERNRARHGLHQRVRGGSVAALLEVDVTRAKHALRHANRAGRPSASLVSWIVRRIAASAPAPVAVTMLVDRDVDGERVTLPLRLDHAATREIDEIEREISSARSTPMRGADLLRMSRNPLTRAVGIVYRALPAGTRKKLVSRAAHRALVRACAPKSPDDVVVTAVGMGGRVRGWFVPRTAGARSVGIGAVGSKAVVMNGRIEARQILHLSVVADQSSAASPRSARWIESLVRGMETGTDLPID